MAKYVLGDEGARKFKQLLQKDLASGNSQRYGRSPVLDNAYPHPFEVRWSNSLLSTNGEPGGYMMWLPDNCLYVDLSCIKTSNFPQISADEIKLVENTDKWYELTPDALSAGNEWPDSFDIWLNDYLSAPTFSISANNSINSGAQPIHITHINNYRPCASVKSTLYIGGGGKADEHSVALTVDVLSNSNSELSTKFHFYHFYDNEKNLSVATLKDGNTIPPDWQVQPFDMIIRNRIPATISSDATAEVNYVSLQSLFEFFNRIYGGGGGGGIGKDIKDGNLKVAVDEHSISLSALNWGKSEQIPDPTKNIALRSSIPQASNANANIQPLRAGGGTIGGSPQTTLGEKITLGNQVTLGEQVKLGDQIKLGDPVYLGPQIRLEDVGGFTYNKKGKDSGGGEGGGSGETSSAISGNNGEMLHLWHFHDHDADVENPEMCDIVLRYYPILSANEAWLRYISLSAFVNRLSNDLSNVIEGGGLNPDNIMSALAVDEQSVSKGGDGWAISSDSGVNPALHMWHFHDSAADVNNPEMCDIVLRYNPERASDDKWLRYISYEDLKAKLSSDIGGGDSGGGGGGGEVTPDQLSAIPCWGMFAWTESTRTMGPGGCMVGRKWYTCTNGIGSGKSDNLYQLRVTIAQGGGVSLAVVSDASLGQAPTTTQCWIPIYQITNGKIAADYRGAFVVPAYE